ncbi:YugN-like protein [Bacillus oleivorans]|uniref:YugN-like protein n=1 Tax=Bacillus oleivorans TaxID=1448271 RepID=A0A285D2A6_9BACI|nr:YugN family protein [Bacillus oleivorans]SNX73323.1 YugN-like protein [Bacillus oleivorans]
MKFENTGIESLKADLSRLDSTMDDYGLIRADQWDYERVSYDRKFEMKEGTYYLRVQGYAVEGDVGGRHAVIQLMTPILGKHYYPHGVEYGEDEHYPNSLVSQCEKILNQLKEEVKQFAL